MIVVGVGSLMVADVRRIREDFGGGV